MYTIEVYVRNQEDLNDITSFLKQKHMVYTKKDIITLNEDPFYSQYAESKEEYVTPSKEFSMLCGKEYLNLAGEIRLKDIYTFLCKQITNPNCFFLESLMQTKEYMNANPMKSEGL